MRTRYSRGFKDQTARRILSGECTLTAMAAETKISKGVLSKWVKSVRTENGNPGALALAGPQPASVAELQARILQLESSLETLRKILADAFASKTSQRFPSGTEWS